jgi:ArsR family transcriptional regulator
MKTNSSDRDQGNKSSALPSPLRLADLLRACADQTRLRLLNLMAVEGEVCVCHLVEVLGTNQPKVSRHLAYLKRAGLVSDRRDGLWVYYRLADSLSTHPVRVIECLTACLAELPEMQQDMEKLRALEGRQQTARFKGLVPGAVTQPEYSLRPVSSLADSQAAALSHFSSEQELQVELL